VNADPVSPLMPHGLGTCIKTVNTAILDGDFDEARLCLAQLREQLGSRRLFALRDTADRMMGILGPAGTLPSSGLGRALVDLTEAFEQVQNH
jgi:hypothetical protein